jgi:hypothetical protein
MTMFRDVRISQIRRDGGTQIRQTMNDEHVQELMDVLTNGGSFPPAVVFDDGTHLWLADGFHRVAAQERMHGPEAIICVDATPGSCRDAILYAVGANTKHGLKRTNQDKRNAVTKMLLDTEWIKWGDEVIANRCGVGQNLVSVVKRELSVQLGVELKLPEKRIGKDGKSYSTQRAQSAKPSKPVSDQKPAECPIEPDDDPEDLMARYDEVQARLTERANAREAAMADDVPSAPSAPITTDDPDVAHVVRMVMIGDFEQIIRTVLLRTTAAQFAFVRRLVGEMSDLP